MGFLHKSVEFHSLLSGANEISDLFLIDSKSKSLNNFTGKKVLFKENYDLTDASLFKVLKSYQWYKNYL